MACSNPYVAAKLRRWEKYLDNYRLPEWEAIPDFGLYMEQVIDLLKQYLDYLPPELKEEQFITASTINNYVRTKVMPEPIKKRYYREHIAYLCAAAYLQREKFYRSDPPAGRADPGAPRVQRERRGQRGGSHHPLGHHRRLLPPAGPEAPAAGGAGDRGTPVLTT